MTIHDVLKLAASDAQGIKEAACQDERQGHYFPLIDVYRGSDPIAVLHLREHRPQTILGACEVAILGFAADLLTVSFEAYEGVDTTLGPGDLNPITGAPWGPGEMAEHVVMHDALLAGYITETLTCLAVNRAGDLACTNMWFRMNGTELTWTRTITFDTLTDEYDATGVAQALREAMLNPPTTSIFPPETDDLDRTGKDILIAQLMASNDVGIGLYSTAGDDDRITRIVQHGKQM